MCSEAAGIYTYMYCCGVVESVGLDVVLERPAAVVDETDDSPALGAAANPDSVWIVK
jgi:hypothetical protein